MEHFPIPGSELAASVSGRPYIALARAWRLSAILDISTQIIRGSQCSANISSACARLCSCSCLR
jgi:hypothetical protein